MTQTRLHFVFTASGAGCLVQAIAKAGRHDQVIASFDDMSFGPINPAERSLRAKWVENELGRADWESCTDDSARVWDEGRFPNGRKVAWLTRHSAREYAGFLEWLWRLGDEPCDLVDLTDVTISYDPEDGPPRQRLAYGLGMLAPETICEQKLWDLAEPLDATARAQHLDLWRQLRSENAPLRVIEGRKLVSAPMSFFDSLLISFATNNWQRVARIVGQSLGSGMDDSLPVDDLLLRLASTPWSKAVASKFGADRHTTSLTARCGFLSQVRRPKARRHSLIERSVDGSHQTAKNSAGSIG